MAQEALRTLQENEESIWTIDEAFLSRMLVCGDCPLSGMDYAEVKVVFRKSVDVLVEKVARYDEWGPDPEVRRTRRAEARRAYREKNGDREAERGKSRRREDRLTLLRRKYGPKDTSKSEG